MAMTVPGAPDVIRGRDGWLFLGEGTNQCYSYLTGRAPIAANAAWHWRKTIERRNRLFPNCLHLICPEKLAVFPGQVEGLEIDRRRLTTHLAAIERVLYPIEELRQARFEDAFSYPRGDTHFNDLGAFVVTRAVLRAFGMDVAFAPEWGRQLTSGDLAVKFDRPERSETIVLTNGTPVTFQENRIVNHGRIIHFRNGSSKGSPGDKKLLIFGDSFSSGNIAQMMMNFFTEVLFIHTLSADYNMIEKFEPDFILFEFAERFLRSVPADGLCVESLVIQKSIEGQRDAVLRWRGDRGNCTRELVNWTILDKYILE